MCVCGVCVCVCVCGVGVGVCGGMCGGGVCLLGWVCVCVFVCFRFIRQSYMLEKFVISVKSVSTIVKINKLFWQEILTPSIQKGNV